MNFDTFTRSRGAKVLEAHSRHMVFLGSNGSRAPDRETGTNTVIAFSEVPSINAAHKWVTNLLGTHDCMSGAVLRYPDINKCGIGWHGHSEARQAIIYRVGDSTSSRPLCFQWYHRTLPIGAPIAIALEHGDMAVFSEKAVGNDWRQKVVPTLRHASGFLKDGPVPAVCSKAAKLAVKRKLEER